MQSIQAVLFVESISSIDQELPGKVVGLDMLNFRLPLSSYFFLLSLYSKGTFVERFSVWSKYGDLMGQEIDQCEMESLDKIMSLEKRMLMYVYLFIYFRFKLVYS
jgi:hypothetical protein